MTTSNQPVIAGCRHIAEYLLADRIISGVIDELIGTTSFKVEVGVKPVMPTPSINPVKTIYGDEIESSLQGLSCTWIQVERLDRYGIYHCYIALFGDRHWVTRERNGQRNLRIFNQPF